MIWNEEQLREEFGVDGYEWFVVKAIPRLTACPYCQGGGVVTIPNDLLNETWAKEGKTTNFTKTEACRVCYDYIDRLTTFVKIWVKTVPPAYRQFTLRTLQPKEGLSVSVKRQQEVFDALRKLGQNPKPGFAFLGPPQAGKTVMTSALYTEALWNETVRAPQYDMKAQKFFPVWRISTKKMLDELTDWSMHRNDKEPEFGLGTPYPTVTVEKIVHVRQYGRTPRLFLEELDKIKETDARRFNLFEVLNAMHDQKGVLVVSSNYSLKDFASMFGDDFAWRIQESCMVVDLFPEKTQ
jgi:hypothetical protein